MIPQSLNNQKIFGLDAMRVMAILLVLAAHCLWIFEGYENLLYKALSFAGFMGVELFFVLSGFLIGDSLYRSFCDSDFRFSSVRLFLRKRSLRILPSYYIALLLNILLAALVGWKIDAVWRYFLFLQNFNEPMLPFFPESWSMSIKEIPYLVLPFVLLLGSAIFRGFSRKWIFFIVVFCGYLLGWILKYRFHTQHLGTIDVGWWNTGMRSVLMYRFDAVLLGILFVVFRRELPSIWSRFRLPMLSVGLFLFLLMAYGIGIAKWNIQEFPLLWNVFLLQFLSLASALSLPFFSSWENASQILERPVEFLGKISYSVYLIHYSLILWPLKIYFPTADLTLSQRFVYMAIYVVLTLAISTVFYRVIERPILRYRQKSIRN